MKHLRIQVPARDEAATIEAVVASALARAEAAWHGEAISVLVVDDASQDGTDVVLRAMTARDPRIHTLRRGTPVGLGAAFRAGLALALEDGADVLLHLDGDGQHDAADLGAVLEPLQRGDADLVLGSRFLDAARIPSDLPPLARVGNRWLAALVSAAAGQSLADVSCGLRAFGPTALRAMRALRSDYTYTHESVLVAAAAGLRIHEVAVDTAGQRRHGRSRLVRNPLRHGLRATLGIARAQLTLRR
ncbi:MAG: hypothetical protein RIT45_2694 [Pseudomonadota bacterium]